MLRRLNVSALFAALAAVVATTAVAAGPTNAAADAPVRVMPLGDSITDGFNVPGGYRIDLWQKLVADGYQVDFVGSMSNGPSSLGDRNHEGHSGWTIAQIDANVVNWLRATTPRTVMLHIGTNDMFGNSSGAPSRLSTLIDKITATAPAADVFVATIVPLSGADSQVRAFNAAIPGIVQSKVDAGRRVHLVDMYNALTLADLADGVHPNARGYSKMAAVWYDALRAVPGAIGGDTPPPTTAPPTTPPPTTPPPTTPPPTTPSPGPGCTASVSLNQWNGGFVATVRVTSGGTSINGWTVTMALPSGATVTNAWNANRSGNTGTVQFANVSYNGSVAAGQSTEFGFQGTGSGTGMAPACSAT
ncbi:cellulose binding domain-containing protein [Micromonospora sp. C51]|uniref:cellulose binding domain-containing protein n=1 Tax=Micromonospora sp. C51 TaxID=2824879 RepID=UPI001B390143|nr:cellulose binding domain-containing protein [Micromonospora sp. C51]MBQ1047053.1 cellulose binding domain-containing protein [Micromonospora sp. C51]